MKKHRLLTAILALVFILAGCNSNKTGDNTGEMPEARVEEPSADNRKVDTEKPEGTSAGICLAI